MVLIYMLSAFAISAILAPFIIGFLRKLKAGQEILKYVDFHQQKSGTPTMGGFIFILPLIALSPIFLRLTTPLSLIIVIASLGFALIGFLDDFIKIRTKNNLGLRAYQKIIGQGGIALLVAIFYVMINPEGRILIPFFNIAWDMGYWIAPLIFIIIIATTNSVNLTDGIDGLAGTVTLVYLAIIGIIISLVDNVITVPEQTQLLSLIAIIIGGLFGFLLFNTNRASVFMGDTGSLFLGSIIATISIFSFLGFFIIILGIMFVISSLTVMIQVAYFKKTKGKRVFLMTPYHHHLEKKGWSEAKIVFTYVTITVIAGALLILPLLY
ncbi:MAG: phospho-N-acetylmuramoyl-pentapeptide-transferase [Firmicutes bacterium]|nr:phospho-N-acetylmuramoyl-pentapeptide-transferase [Bacillota bacterium]